LNFCEKFFCIKRINGEFEWITFDDNLGGGAFRDIRHYLCMALIVAICLVCCFIFSRHKKAARPFALAVTFTMLVFRLAVYTTRAAVRGVWLSELPWNMCTIMSYMLPFVILFRWKALAQTVYTLSITGGFAYSFLFPSVYANSFFALFELESLWVHAVLIYIPVTLMAAGEFWLELKRWWHTAVGVCICAGVAVLGNIYDPASNYMGLNYNILPNNFAGDYFPLVYAALFAVYLSLFYGGFAFARYIRAKQTASTPLSRDS
jgi:hypothetical protein